MIDLPINCLHEMFRYDAATGIVYWRVNRGTRACAGKQAGYQTVYGDLVVQCAGKKYHLHRIVWAMANGSWPVSVIDHVDGDPSNNRLANLRAATVGENAYNQGKTKRNTSGFKGVYRHRNKWRAEITARGKTTTIGAYDTKEAAAAAYDSEAHRLHGAFARTNGLVHGY